MTNPTAGSGDPYWYEWSIGQEYVVKMLYPETGIEWVTLQSKDAQGLDDVVVGYSNGHTECLQIKHTRNNNKITFGALVAPTEEDKDPLLRSLAKAWKLAKENWTHCKPVLFTNRRIGVKASTVRMTQHKRPALKVFWEDLQQQLLNAQQLQDIKMKDEWSEAWTEWRNQLVALDGDQEQLQFLKSLVIKTDQPDLVEITVRLERLISLAFGITMLQAKDVLSRLDNALRIWATQNRKRERITREEVYQVLSLSATETVGDHELPPPEPFFPSRLQFVEDLAHELLKPSGAPVVFLTGLPGMGKTSIVSTLSNHRERVIKLRFHAFRPITPETRLLPADSGKTTKPEVLWGDLLAQLRVLFRGRLAELRIPIRNEYLVVERLRCEVLRLADLYGQEQGRPTVIAIDGIDHAARAGMDGQAFLNTLVPPDAVPEHVRFLIVGQPAEDYEQYPYWLADADENISRRSVQGIQGEDISSLLGSLNRTIPADQRDVAVRVIDKIAQGNTLAAIFAVHEARDCTSVGQLEDRLAKRKLASGISAYYHEIWRAVVTPLERAAPFIGYQLAGALSLVSVRITGKLLANTFPNQFVDWTHALRSLRPLVLEEEGGFRLTHNDVRVHLTKLLHTQPEMLKEISGQLADYFWRSPSTAIERHVDLFKLLGLADRHADQARAFTPEYVMEGYALDRPMSELLEQCRSALKALHGLEDWDCIHAVACAASTLVQLEKSVGWTGEDLDFESPRNELPSVLLSEKRVVSKELWDKRVVDEVLSDALRLIDAEEVERARGIMSRWFTDLSPVHLMRMLPKKQIYHEVHDDPFLSSNFRDTLRKWGKISQYVGLLWDASDERNEEADKISKIEFSALATFYGGYLKAAATKGGVTRWMRSLKQITTWYWDDIEECLTMYADHRKWTEIAFTLRKSIKRRHKLPLSLQIKGALYSLFIGRNDLILDWAEPIASMEFDELTKRKQEVDLKRLDLYCMTSFVIGWLRPVREPGGIASDGVASYFIRGGDDRAAGHVSAMFRASAFVGRLMGTLSRRGATAARDMVTVREMELVLRALVQERSASQMEFGYFNVTQRLIELIAETSGHLGPLYSDMVYAFMKSQCESYPAHYLLEIGWRYLADRWEHDLLSQWFDYWCGSEGKAWHEDIGERNDIVSRMIVLAEEIGLEQEAEGARQRLKWGQVSYTGHKEYALESPLKWFDALVDRDPEAWQVEGLRLLDVSKEASSVGDNRLSQTVNESLFVSAARNGVEAMWRLCNAANVEPPFLVEPVTITEGLIEMLSKTDLPEKELLGLWAFGNGAFSWQKASDRGYLRRLRSAILQVAERNGIQNLDSRLDQLGISKQSLDAGLSRYESLERKDQPKQEFLEDLKNVPIPNAIDQLYIRLDEDDGYSIGTIWQGIGIVTRRLKQERPPAGMTLFQRLVELIYRRSTTYSKSYSWTNDSAQEAFKELIPMAPKHIRFEMLKRLLEDIETTDKPRFWLGSAAENLDLFCLYQAQSSGTDSIRAGLRRLLTTHETWIHGNGHLPEIKRIVLPDKEQSDGPTTWTQFAACYFVHILKTDNTLRIEAALRGLYALAQIDPTAMTWVVNGWDQFHISAKEWLLLVVERLSVNVPAAYELFAPIVEQCMESTDLTLKLQAWVILGGIARRNDEDSVDFKISKNPYSEILDSISYEEERGLLEVPGEVYGSVYSTYGRHMALDILEQLQNSLQDDVTDIEKKFAAYAKLKVPEPTKLVKIESYPGDSMINPAPEKLQLMEVIYHELHAGKWDDVPPIRFAQALLLDDDPYILLETPNAASDHQQWAIDRELQEILDNQHLVKERLLPHVQAGLADDEMVLAAVLLTYCEDADVKLVYDTAFAHPDYPLIKVPRIATFCGRLFAVYDPCRFDRQAGGDAPVIRSTYEVAGFGQFVHQTLFCYPSLIWSEGFGWEPSPQDPTIWMKDDVSVVRLEYVHGPFRHQIHDRYYRQPVMQRWVCSKVAFEQALQKIGGNAMPTTFVDIGPISG